MPRSIAVVILVLLGAAGGARAQVLSPNAAGVAMGHLHYNVKNMEANRNFWIALGGQPVMMGTREVFKFPGVLILLNQADPTAGTEGSVINHVGFRVQNTVETLARLKALGYKTETAPSGTLTVGSVYGPEDERIELLEDQSINLKFAADGQEYRYTPPPPMSDPITLHHVHYYVPEKDVKAVKDWYVTLFGAVPGRRFRSLDESYEAADLPGMNINVAPHEQLAPLKGRRLDHIGFEVRNLAAFCKKLEASGVKFDRPYAKNPAGLATAFFTDPWGVYVELTEGLNTVK
jgi:catechol 2,3-dioxygenase-like lactoylglutathione lyase family enzyme